jgi:hypothetical protein
MSYFVNDMKDTIRCCYVRGSYVCNSTNKRLEIDTGIMTVLLQKDT